MNINILLFKDIVIFSELFLGISIIYLVMHFTFLSVQKKYPLVQNSVVYLSILSLIFSVYLIKNEHLNVIEVSFLLDYTGNNIMLNHFYYNEIIDNLSGSLKCNFYSEGYRHLWLIVKNDVVDFGICSVLSLLDSLSWPWTFFRDANSGSNNESNIIIPDSGFPEPGGEDPNRRNNNTITIHINAAGVTTTTHTICKC